MIEGFYSADIALGAIPVDKSRDWLPNYNLLNRVFGGDVKMIVTIRDLRGVLASFEKKYRKHPERFEGNVNSVEDRVNNWLAPDFIVTPYLNAIREAHLQKFADKLLFVRAEDLARYPEREFERIYEYLEMDYFYHDFGNVKQRTHEHDGLHEPFGDHRVHEGVVAPLEDDYLDVLGQSLCSKIVTNHSWYYTRFYPEIG
jgi:sulfotransferase